MILEFTNRLVNEFMILASPSFPCKEQEEKRRTLSQP